MGSGNWFKTIISSRKGKGKNTKQGSSTPGKSNNFKWKHHSRIKSGHLISNATSRTLIENVAAIRIQTAFRAHMARKKLRYMKGVVRLQTHTQGLSVRKHSSSTLQNLHSWSRIQAEISARRLSRVTEGRNRRKKMGNQLKLEAEIHDLEVEWCSGSETMEEILARIHQRHEAAVKRERAMAYAFSHQWRPNSNLNLGPNRYELGMVTWCWSWVERWAIARPWECRIGNPNTKSVPVRPGSSGGKGSLKPRRRWSYPAAEKRLANRGNGSPGEEKNQK